MELRELRAGRTDREAIPQIAVGEALLVAHALALRGRTERVLRCRDRHAARAIGGGGRRELDEPAVWRFVIARGDGPVVDRILGPRRCWTERQKQ